MTAPIVLLHTFDRDIPLFSAVFRRRAPALTVRHIVDADLLAKTRAAGSVTPTVVAAVSAHVRGAARDGAKLVLCTCASLGEAVDDAGRDGGIPVLRIDRPIAEAAVARDGRIGVLISRSTAMLPVCLLIEQLAALRGVTITLDVVRVQDDAIVAADSPQPHTLAEVSRAVTELTSRCDVVVVPEPSVAAALPREAVFSSPVLLSPDAAADAAMTLITNE